GREPDDAGTRDRSFDVDHDERRRCRLGRGLDDLDRYERGRARAHDHDERAGGDGDDDGDDDGYRAGHDGSVANSRRRGKPRKGSWPSHVRVTLGPKMWDHIRLIRAAALPGGLHLHDRDGKTADRLAVD